MLKDTRTSIDGTSILEGSAQGQMAFWDDTLSSWVHTETNELFWDDTNKRLGLGTNDPDTAFHIRGITSNDIATLDVGLNFKTVAPPQASAISLITEAGNIDNGQHYYRINYYTALGETQLRATSPTSVTTDITHGKVNVTLPVSSDYRVIGRRIYRTIAGSASYQNLKLVATIANNTDTNYIDNIADADLTGDNYYFSDNSTNKFISVDGIPVFKTTFTNTILGYYAGETIHAGTAYSSEHVLIGTSAGRTLTTASKNVAIGQDVLSNATTSGSNVCVGHNASKYLTIGDGKNISIGRNAGYYNLEGIRNVCIGSDSGFGVSTTSNNRNTFVGYNSGKGITTGSNNILLGYCTGDSLTSGASNIAIGYSVDLPSNTGNYQMTIGNLIFGTGLSSIGTTISSGNIGISVPDPTAKLDIDGDTIRLRTPKTPASAGAAGNTGDECWDENYNYRWVATNTCKRTPLSTW